MTDRTLVCDACVRCLERHPFLDARHPASRMVVCPTCGNKRCPKAEWHEYECSGSNEVGQVGRLAGERTRTMTARDFVFWLQGFFEIDGTGAGLTPTQTACIKRHLALVFVHDIDPSMGDAAHQAKLDEVHAPPAAKPALPGTPPPGRWPPVMRC